MSASNRVRALQYVRNWNEAFRPGQTVVFEGKPHKTESPAGLGLKDVPAVFINGVQEPVPLDRLDVPGWKRK